jgi:hypothetical protein
MEAKKELERFKELEAIATDLADLAIYWINREDKRKMSSAEYAIWYELGYGSRVMQRWREYTSRKQPQTLPEDDA